MPNPKLLWVSDNPKFAYVGQSRVTREICDRLMPFYDINVAGFYEPERKDGKRTEMEINRQWKYPINVIERNKEETLQAVIDKVQPDVLLISHDCWLFPEASTWKFPKTKTIGYFTIDGDPVSKIWRGLLYNMDQIVVPTNYAKNVLQKRFHDLRVEVVPYGIDHQTFSHPVDKEVYKKNVSAALSSTEGQKVGYDFSNKFVCSFYGHNHTKKNIACIYDAWTRFCKDKNDVNLVFVVHSRISKRGIWTVIADYDITEYMYEDSCVVINGVFEDTIISSLLKASDCLLFPSVGEGFGLPVLEALACGTTPIVTNFSGVTDFSNENNSFMLPWIPMVGDWNTVRAIVDPIELHKKLEIAYKMWKENDPVFEKMKVNGIQESMKYSWDNTAKMMHSVIQNTLSTSLNYNNQILKRI